MFKIALRNILRNWRRTFLTGLSIMVAVMLAIFLWSFVRGMMTNMFENMIKLSSGHVRILNADYVRREKMLPLEANIASPEAIEKLARSLPEVIVTSGHVKFGVLLEHKGTTKSVVGLGIDPDKEEPINNLSTKILKGRKVVMGAEETNVGEKLARELGLKLGDTLTVITQTAYGSMAAMNLKIVGIYSFGIPSIDGKIFYLPLDKAQHLLDLDGRVTEIFVIIKDMNKAGVAAKNLQARLDQFAPGRFATKSWSDQGMIVIWMQIARYVYSGIYGLILVFASFTILNTMLMAVMERTKEIGMMKALGMKDREIVWMVMIEALLIGFFASLLGAVLGSGIAWYISTVGIDYTSTMKTVNFDLPLSYIYYGLFRWSFILTGFGLGMLFALIAAIPAALRAARMEPTEALRE